MSNYIYKEQVVHICQNCGDDFAAKGDRKFCSKSCSASYNNRGIRRHGSPASTCQYCGNITSGATRKYCSPQCSGAARKTKSIEEQRKLNRDRQARYRAKNLRKYAPNANREKIREIYKNCPDGYEVDHIRPLSKGGLHHEDNLQYLTVNENRKKGNKINHKDK